MNYDLQFTLCQKLANFTDLERSDSVKAKKTTIKRCSNISVSILYLA